MWRRRRRPFMIDQLRNANTTSGWMLIPVHFSRRLAREKKMMIKNEMLVWILTFHEMACVRLKTTLGATLFPHLAHAHFVSRMTRTLSREFCDRKGRDLERTTDQSGLAQPPQGASRRFLFCFFFCQLGQKLEEGWLCST